MYIKRPRHLGSEQLFFFWLKDIIVLDTFFFHLSHYSIIISLSPFFSLHKSSCVSINE